MRVPTYERRRFRVRGWMIAFVIVLLVLLFSLRGLAGFYTDYLWFDSLGQGGTWGSLLAAKIVPAARVHGRVLRDHVREPASSPTGSHPGSAGMGPPTPEDEMVARYQQTTGAVHRAASGSASRCSSP